MAFFMGCTKPALRKCAGGLVPSMESIGDWLELANARFEYLEISARRSREEDFRHVFPAYAGVIRTDMVTID